jgi:hypothetical protein
VLFWSLTMRQVVLHFRAAQVRDIRAHNDRAWLAHTTARLMHYHHEPRKLPRLQTLVVHDPGRRRRQTAADQLAMVRAIVDAFEAVGRGASPGTDR